MPDSSVPRDDGGGAHDASDQDASSEDASSGDAGEADAGDGGADRDAQIDEDSDAAQPIIHVIDISGDAMILTLPLTQEVADGDTVMMTITAATGYAVSSVVGGTCPAGSWSGGTYTTGAITADCTVVFSSLPTFEVTASGVGVGVTPSAPQSVAQGLAATFTLATPDFHAVDVSGTCPIGSFSLDQYTTGPITEDCTVELTVGCQYCGAECAYVKPYELPEVDMQAETVCTTACVGATHFTQRCGDCDRECGVAQTCMNGECQCRAGHEQCVPTLPFPHRCMGALPQCFFMQSLDAADPWQYRVVELDGYQDQDLWIHLELASFVHGSREMIPHFAFCDPDHGQLFYSTLLAQANAFDGNGVIIDQAELADRTQNTLNCQSWDDFPFLSLLNSTVTNNKGYYLRFVPDEGESGMAYHTFAIMGQWSPYAPWGWYPVIYYVINVWPASPPPMTITAQGLLSATQSVAHNSSASFTVPGGPVSVAGTCPAGSWEGDVYTTGASFTDCVVVFGGGDFTVSASGDETATPSAPSTIVAPYRVASFDVTVAAGRFPKVAGGTCPRGHFNGTTYLTGAIRESCDVQFTSDVCSGETCSALFDPPGTVSPTDYQGGSGGLPFGPDTCPDGMAIVGFSGHNGPNTEAIAAICGSPILGTYGGESWVTVGGTTTTLTEHGNTSSGQAAFNLRCPADSVVTRVDGHFDTDDHSGTGGPTQGLHELTIYCSTFKPRASGYRFMTPEAVGSTSPGYDPGAQTVAFSSECPDGTAMVSISGRSGDWIDGVSFGCATP